MSEAELRVDARYHSVLVELLRHGGDEGILRKDIRYLVQVEDKPVKEVVSPIEQLEFLDRLSELDYRCDDKSRAAAMASLSDAVTDVLGQIGIEYPKTPLQIDLVVSAGELSALPFELARDQDGSWLLAHPDRDIEITRRVRLGFNHRQLHWPAKPRILFVSASPPEAGNPVPGDASKVALRSALYPWIEPLEGFPEAVPDERTVLRLLENATLRRISYACANVGFTPIHILAHGIAINRKHREHFGLALHAEDGSCVATTPEDLAAALAPTMPTCAVVTLTVCESGNETNTILPGASIARKLHEAGVPVVIGCQFPMTIDGAPRFMEHFYKPLLRGEDVRAALHAARRELHAQSALAHDDWGALVGYVRLPEGYADDLIGVALEADLASLRTAQAWFDHITMTEPPPTAALSKVAERFEERIGYLQARLGQAETCGRKGIYEENLGLLGSAEKRLADVHFRLSKRGSDDAHREAMSAALQRSLDHYRRSFRRNPSHHWTGVQMLSLMAVIYGKIDNAKYWYAAMVAAEGALEDEGDYWAAGSALELHLLATYGGQPNAMAAALDSARVLARRVPLPRPCEPPLPFPIESTRRQLQRYCAWWTTANGFFPGSGDLTDAATELIAELDSCWATCCAGG
jgi:hypothetical protein